VTEPRSITPPIAAFLGAFLAVLAIYTVDVVRDLDTRVTINEFEDENRWLKAKDQRDKARAALIELDKGAGQRFANHATQMNAQGEVVKKLQETQGKIVGALNRGPQQPAPAKAPKK